MAKAATDFASFLTSVNPPYVHRILAEKTELEQAVRDAEISHLFEVELGHCSSLSDAFRSFMTGLSLPYRNLNTDAFVDVMRDLHPINPKGAFVVILSQADLFLRRNTSGFEELTSLLNSIGSEWAKAIAHGSQFDRPSVAFHVLVPVSSSIRLPLPAADYPL
ncbi:barstar family protein [Rhizobium sp. ZW T2_16]|jgi:hypothetical protein|uniref:barstar family protein n=1 Tax=Rhizobium sp. ZW T2_16 TaxID=3378083 RepID=UPI003852232D